MAQITLAPHEVFEHIHPHVSTTTLVEGNLSLVMNGETRVLMPGETVVVPAHTVHRMVNTGTITSIVCCGHGGDPPTA